MSEPRTLSNMLAERFHETYERLAPKFGYRTREASAVAWSDVPEANKALMTAVVQELRDTGYVVVPYPGPAPDEPRATLREDERVVAEVLAAHGVGAFSGGETACTCDRTWRTNAAHRAHVAEQLAPVVAAARAEGVAQGRREGAGIVMGNLIDGLDEYAAGLTTRDAATPEHVAGIEDARGLVWELACKVTPDAAARIAGAS